MGSRLPLRVQADATTKSALALWREMCEDLYFADAPFKVETNLQGQIIMSPVSWLHGAYQSEILMLIRKHADAAGAKGRLIVECAVLTSDGVKVPDVAWVTAERLKSNQDSMVITSGPQICVEVLSPSNTMAERSKKATLYFAAGSAEVWLCGPTGEMTFLEASGERAASAIFPDFPKTVVLEDLG